MELIEKVDVNRVKYLLGLEHIYYDSLEMDHDVKISLEKYIKGYNKSKKFIAEYRTIKKYGDYGRLYPYNKFGKGGCYTGLQVFPRKVRSYLANENYIDIDMKRAHWYILSYLFKKYNFDTSIIEVVLDDYTNMIDKIVYNNYTIEDAKKKLFGVLYSSPTYLSNDANLFLNSFPKLKSLYSMLYSFFLPRIQDEYPDLYKIVKKDEKTNKKNIDGSFLSHVLQHHEKLIILEVVQSISTFGIDCGVLIHDGFLSSKTDIDLQMIFDKIYDIMAEKFDGLKCILVVKPFEKYDWPDDVSFLDKEDDSTSYLTLCNTLFDYMKDNRLVYDEWSIYQQDEEQPMLYKVLYATGKQLHAYNKLITKVYMDNRLYHSEAKYYDQIYKLLEYHKTDFVKIYNPNKDWIAFKNGSLNLKQNKFIPLEDFKEEHYDIVARHYIDKNYDANNFNTPLFDDFLMYQIQDTEALKWFYIMIARLFFTPDNDSLQVMMYIYGMKNTGKSVIASVLSKLFSPKNIMDINSTQEQIFGLDNLRGKEVIIARDVPEDLSKMLSEDLFKKTVSGEPCNIARKNKSSVCEEWETPMVFMSNYLPNYQDNNGAVSKRIAIFSFQRKVEVENSNLQHLIIQDELVAIINKSLTYYYETAYTTTFESMRPAYFKRTSDLYVESVDTLYQFLQQNDCEDRNGFIHRINIEPDNENLYEMLNDVDRKYQNYCKYSKVKPTWKKSDHSVFVKFGLKVKELNICKSCKKKASSNPRCCIQYNSKNRSKNLCVIGLKFDRDRSGDIEVEVD